MRYCETCGKPAKHMIRDSRETGLKEGEDGRHWKTFEPGPIHHFCDDHVRRPQTLAKVEELFGPSLECKWHRA